MVFCGLAHFHGGLKLLVLHSTPEVAMYVTQKGLDMSLSQYILTLIFVNSYPNLNLQTTVHT